MKKLVSILTAFTMVLALSNLTLHNIQVLASDSDVIQDTKLKQAINKHLSVSDESTNISKSQLESLTEAKAVLLKSDLILEDLTIAIGKLNSALDSLRGNIPNMSVKTKDGKEVISGTINSISNLYKKVQNAVVGIKSNSIFTNKYNPQNAKVLNIIDISVVGANPVGETIKLSLDALSSGQKYVLAHYN